MSYAENIRALLRPLGIFALDSGFVCSETDVLGREIDGCAERIDSILTEGSLRTARDYGLAYIEDILPWKPVAAGLENRRKSLIALLNIGGDGFTLSAMNRAVNGCGIEAVVEEGNGGTLIVAFPDWFGKPDDFDKIEEIIRGILPCHLGIEFKITYLNWDMFESYGLTWDGIEALALSWNRLEGLKV